MAAHKDFSVDWEATLINDAPVTYYSVSEIRPTIEERIAQYLGETDCEIDYIVPRAVLHDDLQVLQHMIALGSDVNILDEFGEAPLHIGMQLLRGECCETLAKAGADFTLRNKRGLLPKESLTALGNQRVIAYLRALCQQVEEGSDVKPITPYSSYCA